MDNNELEFLKEYKELCLKHGMQILGWDDGAYLMKLEKDEIENAVITWEEVAHSDGSITCKNVRLAGHYDIGEMQAGRRNAIK